MPKEKKYYKYDPVENYEKCFSFEGSPWTNRRQWLKWATQGFNKQWASHPIKDAKKTLKTALNGLIPCRWCQKEMTHKECNVVHINNPLGLKDVSDVQAFFKRMFVVGLDDVQCVCDDCKKIVEYGWKNDLNYWQAQCFVNALNVVGDVDWLQERGIVPKRKKSERVEQIAHKMMEDKRVSLPSPSKKKN